MNKRKVRFNDDVQEKKFKPDDSKSSRFKDGNCIDSDDEDNVNAAKTENEENILHEDDIEGQEEETIRNDEGIAVTPFNLKEEMEEGHFDAQGNYIAHENTEDIRDNWLDSVDWNKVKDKTDNTSNQVDENLDENLPILNRVKAKKEMLNYIKQGENTLRAIRRLGGNKKQQSTADRWKKKKQSQDVEEDEKSKQNKADMLRLTGLADDLLQNGDFQIYEKTYEQLQYEIKNSVDDSQFDDADEDMHNEDDDELEAAFRSSRKDDNKDLEKENKTDDSKVDLIDLEKEVMWVYKLKDALDAELLGPVTNSQMLKWQEEGHFKTAIYCRKVDSEGQFYNSRRVDFDLYS